MILDLENFIQREKRYWEEFEDLLETIEHRPEGKVEVQEIQRLHYLYRRTASDLTKLKSFSADRATREYLENLISRAFPIIYGGTGQEESFSILKWFRKTVPRTFRRHIGAFVLSLAVFLTGALMGCGFLIADRNSKSVLLPFAHLQQHPSKQVERAESRDYDMVEQRKSRFSARLFQHNTKLSLMLFGLGLTWGIGTIAMLFYNGVILGAVSADFVLAGETTYLLGWLLPHGIVEIPAFLVAGQAGLILAGALIGWGERTPLFERFRDRLQPLVVFLVCVVIMLFWAGGVEGFLSQYHEPVLSYNLKIMFGVAEGLALVAYFGLMGRGEEEDE